MKKKLYFYACFGIVVVLAAFYACTRESDSFDAQEQERLVNPTVIKAQSYFEEFLGSQWAEEAFAYGSGKGLDPGFFTPKWESAVISRNNETVSIEVEIDAANYYIASPRNPNDNMALTDKVLIAQKLLIVTDQDSVKGSYIMTVIPGSERVAKDQNTADTKFRNSRTPSDFSGVVMYTQTGLNIPVRVDEYENGTKSRSASVFEDEVNSELARKMEAIMSGLKILRFTKSGTRGNPSPSPGFPGSPDSSAYQLEAVYIIAPNRDGEGGWPWGIGYWPWYDPFGDLNPIDPNPGGGVLVPPQPNTCQNCSPCTCVIDLANNKSIPLKTMKLQPPALSKIKAATFGPDVRQFADGRPKPHDGVDFYGAVGTPIYSMFEGIVVGPKLVTEQPDKVDKKYPNGYGGDINGAGNRIYVRSTVNGKTITVSYFHLQAGNPVGINPATGATYRLGDTVMAGAIVGYVGVTGNADQALPHLHLGVQNSAGAWINPTTYLNATISDKSTSVAIAESSQCKCK